MLEYKLKRSLIKRTYMKLDTNSSDSHIYDRHLDPLAIIPAVYVIAQNDSRSTTGVCVTVTVTLDHIIFAFL